MFASVCTKLMEGRFLCKYTAEHEFRYLQEPDNFESVVDYLRPINMKVSRTMNGVAFYASYISLDKDAHKAVKDIFKGMKSEIYDVISWINLLMESQDMEKCLMEGDLISSSRLTNILENNQLYKSRLFNFHCIRDSKENSVSGRLDRLMRRMEQWGYVVSLDNEFESYQVTGKIDYYYEMIEFIIQADNLNVEHSENFEEGSFAYKQESLF